MKLTKDSIKWERQDSFVHRRKILSNAIIVLTNYVTKTYRWAISSDLWLLVLGKTKHKICRKIFLKYISQILIEHSVNEYPVGQIPLSATYEVHLTLFLHSVNSNSNNDIA